MPQSTRRLVTELLKVLPELGKAMHEQHQQHLNRLQAHNVPPAVRKVLEGDSKPTEAQMLLGIELVQEGPATIRDLSQRLGVTPAAISLLVDRMAQHGWVERVRDTADRRVVWVTLTPGAAAIAETMIRAQRERVAQFLESVPEDERDSFVRNVRRFARVLGRDTGTERGARNGAIRERRSERDGAAEAPACAADGECTTAADGSPERRVGTPAARAVAER